MLSFHRLTAIPAAALAVWGCGGGDPGVGPEEVPDDLPDLAGLPVSESVVDAAPAVCGASTEVDLVSIFWTSPI